MDFNDCDSSKVKERIKAFEEKYPFAAKDFEDITNRINASKILSRMNHNEEILRIRQGYYIKNTTSENQ